MKKNPIPHLSPPLQKKYMMLNSLPTPRIYIDLSIFRAGPKKNYVISGRKILLMTIPLDASGLDFRAWAGRPHIL
jgi:hypothetical protein